MIQGEKTKNKTKKTFKMGKRLYISQLSWVFHSWVTVYCSVYKNMQLDTLYLDAHI